MKGKKIIRLLTLSILFLFSLAAKAQAENSLLRNPSDPVAGNPRGNVTVVEFFDYECSHCVNMAPVIDAIIRKNPNVRIVFKDFPIRGPMSEFAARAALAAKSQGKYYSFNRALLTADEPLSRNRIYAIASKMGMNIAKLKRDMYSSKVTSQLNATLRLAQQLNITGTPAFFIAKTNATQSNENNFVMGEMSQNELQEAIDKAAN